MATKKTLWPVTTVTIILGMLVLPVFPQDEPPPSAGDTSEDIVRGLIAEVRKKAEQGDIFAQHTLGSLYELGMGVPQDYREAVRWYRAAAEQGYASAQYQLGEEYYDGEGVPQDYQEAVRWYRAAAEQGHTLARSYLGFMYYRNGRASGLQGSYPVVSSSSRARKCVCTNPPWLHV